MLRFSQLQNNALIRLLNDLMFLFLAYCTFRSVSHNHAKQHVALCDTTRMYSKYREMH